MNFKAAFIAGLAWAALPHTASAQTVQTSSGVVRGATSDDVESYRGIPYAAAPVGDLRWTPPQPAPVWKGVRDAARYQPMCPQPPFGDAPITQPMSEDCLFLNIWSAPQADSGKKPVMVFIHGGAYEGGSGSDPLYDGSNLAKKGVVAVTINYRLGTLGFLAHPALSAASPEHASGNYGMLDQIAALQWVQKNIGAFGGDPSQVTIFGESAGGNAVMMLMASPLSKGLFSKVIAQSPVGGYRIPTLAEAEAMGAKLGSIDELRALPAEKLLAFNLKLRPRTPPLAPKTLAGPVLDNHFLSQQPAKSLANPVPLIIGSNADEGSMFAPETTARTKAAFDLGVKQVFGPRAPEALALYSPKSDAEVMRQNAELVSDGLFNAAARYLAAQVAAAGQPVYRYVFSLDMAGRTPLHSDELRYVFGTTHLPGYTGLPAATDQDRRTSELMMDAWVRFAKTGSPAGGGLEWPAVTGSKGAPILDVNATPRVLTGYRDSQLDLIDKLHAGPIGDQ
jgi:para-nitrobenzyl esterase